MELNRRNFIKFVVGGVAGVQLTPLPWKLTDDIAIWTQNWPWVPVPPEGAFTHVKSVCLLCPGGCGIEVRKVDQRAVKIEGRTDYPVNPGGICPIGMGGLQLLYNEDIRFTGPMKRVGPRGAGKFADISWDEAFEILSDKISDLRGKGKPEAVAAIDGNPEHSTLSLLVRRLLLAIGTPNYVRIPRAEDTYETMSVLMQGNKDPMGFDIENADFVLSFGAGLIEGWGSPGRMIHAWALSKEGARKGKTKVVQVESRSSTTASKADQWVAIKPGTEAALALGMAHILIKERLYDLEFINNHSFGFADWTGNDGQSHMGFKTLVMNQYAPSRVSEITGLAESEIVSLAREFGKAKAPLAIFGKGKGDLNGDLYEFMSIHSLNALSGNINKPGGILLHQPLPLSPLPSFEMDHVASEGHQRPRLDKAGSGSFPFTRSLINNFAEAINQSETSPVDLLMVFSSNPAFTLPDGGDFRKALKKIPLIVSFSPFRDETAYMADLILPDHIYLEKMEDMVWPSGLQYPFYAVSQPVVKPLYNTMATEDGLIRIAKKIGEAVAAAFPWKDYGEILKERVKGLFESEGGMTHYDSANPPWKQLKDGQPVQADYTSLDELWDRLSGGGFWYRPVYLRKNWDGIFKTPSSKFEFFLNRLQLALSDTTPKGDIGAGLGAMGIHAKGDEAFMPHYESERGEPMGSEYPLRMVPYELITLSSGWVPTPPYLFKLIPDTVLLKQDAFVEIHPETATRFGLAQGDRVSVESPDGAIVVRVNLFEGAMPGFVYLLRGFGHTAYDEFLRGKGENPNQIVQAGRDPLSGSIVWWNTPVRLTKA
jgi:anaerobic selenocysteine-containing dehydrogenase